MYLIMRQYPLTQGSSLLPQVVLDVMWNGRFLSTVAKMNQHAPGLLDETRLAS